MTCWCSLHFADIFKENDLFKNQLPPCYISDSSSPCQSKQLRFRKRVQTKPPKVPIIFLHLPSCIQVPMLDRINVVRVVRGHCSFGRIHTYLPSSLTCIGNTLQVLPCGMIIWNGLPGLFKFHSVKLPSEWLHIKCFPSLCHPIE